MPTLLDAATYVVIAVLAWLAWRKLAEFDKLNAKVRQAPELKQISERVRRSYRVREFLMKCSAPMDQPADLLTAPGIPRTERGGDRHPDNSLLRCKHVAIRPLSRRYYEIVCTYGLEGETDANA